MTGKILIANDLKVVFQFRKKNFRHGINKQKPSFHTFRALSNRALFKLPVFLSNYHQRLHREMVVMA